MKQYYSMDKEDVIQKLESNEQGLSSSEVNKRLKKNGYNQISSQKKYLILENF